jgi:hypothetical protein
MSISYHLCTDAPGSVVAGALFVFGYQSFPDRESYQASQVSDSEPFHDRAAMRFDGLHAQTKPGGDLLRRVSLGDESENFALSRGEKI